MGDLKKTGKTQEGQKANEQKNSINFFSLITEIIAWLQIAASPFLISIATGFIIYIFKPGKLGFVIAISIAIVGLVIGITCAVKVWKKKGTVQFMSTLWHHLSLKTQMTKKNSVNLFWYLSKPQILTSSISNLTVHECDPESLYSRHRFKQKFQRIAKVGHVIAPVSN